MKSPLKYFALLSSIACNNPWMTLVLRMWRLCHFHLRGDQSGTYCFPRMFSSFSIFNLVLRKPSANKHMSRAFLVIWALSFQKAIKRWAGGAVCLDANLWGELAMKLAMPRFKSTHFHHQHPSMKIRSVLFPETGPLGLHLNILESAAFIFRRMILKSPVRTSNPGGREKGKTMNWNLDNWNQLLFLQPSLVYQPTTQLSSRKQGLKIHFLPEEELRQRDN